MKWSRRGICWAAVIISIAALTGVTIRASVNGWATEDALGDVAVSFDGTVRTYGNADGLQKGTDLTVPGTTSGGLTFDNELNLLVANTSNNQLAKFSEDSAHGLSTITTPTAPGSVVIA